MSDRPHKLPPVENNSGPLFGPEILSFGVVDWCPTPDGTGPATAVAIVVEAKWNDDIPKMDIVIRIKSPQELDRVVQMLLRHKRSVWPEAK